MNDPHKIIGKVSDGRNSKIYKASDISLSDVSNLDTLTNLSVLTTLAAYDQAEIITVNGHVPKTINNSEVAKFLAYVVNHPMFAPKKYKFSIIYKDYDSSSSDDTSPQLSLPQKVGSIVTFSGGIDSTAGLLYMLENDLDVIPFTLYMGQKNEKYEKEIVSSLSKKLKIKTYRVDLDISPKIEANKKYWDYIIPARNFIYITYAAKVISLTAAKTKHIYLFAHKDEMDKVRNTDKSEYFLTESAKLFSKYYKREYKCVTPFKDIDKTQVLSYWKKNWLKRFRISPHDTTTCHEARACGICDGCLKRTISLLAAGFTADPYIDSHPLADKGGIIKNSWLPMIKEKRLSQVRLYDLLIALSRTDQSILPSHVKDLMKLNGSLQSAINERIRNIENAKLEYEPN